MGLKKQSRRGWLGADELTSRLKKGDTNLVAFGRHFLANAVAAPGVIDRDMPDFTKTEACREVRLGCRH